VGTVRGSGQRCEARNRLTERAITPTSDGEQVLKKARVQIGGGVQGGFASGERVDIPHVALLAAGM
jgi:hypothetical protein